VRALLIGTQPAGDLLCPLTHRTVNGFEPVLVFRSLVMLPLRGLLRCFRLRLIVGRITEED
jgi:hypothetical protein